MSLWWRQEGHSATIAPVYKYDNNFGNLAPW